MQESHQILLSKGVKHPLKLALNSPDIKYFHAYIYCGQSLWSAVTQINLWALIGQFNVIDQNNSYMIENLNFLLISDSEYNMYKLSWLGVQELIKKTVPKAITGTKHVKTFYIIVNAFILQVFLRLWSFPNLMISSIRDIKSHKN